MTRARTFTVAAAGALALAGVLYLRSGGAPAPAPDAARDAPLRAEAWVVESSPVRETVKSVGTLAANESVDVVAELSRRLVAVEVVEGSDVEEGELLFKLDDSDLRAELEELEARRRLAARTEQRQRALLEFQKKALSQQAYDQAVAELEAVSAEITALRVTLAKTEIRAPFRARVGLRRVSEGAWITPETKLTTLQDVSRIKVDFSLPERYAGAVAIGQGFHFRVSGRGEDFEARVIAIEPVIDAPTRSLLVRGIGENPGGVLLPGAFAAVEVAVEQAQAGIMLPAQAIVPSATGHAVYLMRDGAAELREVEIGLRTPEAVQILRGLAPGETVLTTNLLRMRAGARVELVNGAGGGS